MTDILSGFPWVRMGHLPTPLEPLHNLGRQPVCEQWVKSDDCTGVGFCGNKIRQLEYCLGKVMTARVARAEKLHRKKVLFGHTSSQSALFGYVDTLRSANDPMFKERT